MRFYNLLKPCKPLNLVQFLRVLSALYTRSCSVARQGKNPTQFAASHEPKDLYILASELTIARVCQRIFFLSNMESVLQPRLKRL